MCVQELVDSIILIQMSILCSLESDSGVSINMKFSKHLPSTFYVAGTETNQLLKVRTNVVHDVAHLLAGLAGIAKF